MSLLNSPPIVACATAWGHAAIATIRLSGTNLGPILQRVCGKSPKKRGIFHVSLSDDQGPFDDGLLCWMPGPSSYTGEDVAEISCHGNPLLTERLLAACIAQGAHLAAPGEFTRRALLNGKIDLCRAEAVLQTIEATSSLGLTIAQQGMTGKTSGAFDALRQPLVDIAAELEAILDYPGEDLIFASDDQLSDRLLAIAQQAEHLAATYHTGKIALQGATISLVGSVNAGKSSLFNALLGRPRALVSPIPGTTRDIVEAPLLLKGAKVLLSDTAGLRDTLDPIEAQGVELARSSALQADLRLLVVPLHRYHEHAATLAYLGTLPPPVLLVGTHADQVVSELPPEFLAHGGLPTSAITGQGIDALKDAIQRALQVEEPGETRVILGSQRQRDILLRCSEQIRNAAETLGIAGPAAAVEYLYEAMESFDALSGRDTREDVMDHLFKRFCVGK